jgi:hypothetical protein
MFIPLYIKETGGKALEDYINAQEEMFRLTEDQDDIRTRLEVLNKLLEGVYKRKSILLSEYPTLHFRRKYA